MTIRHLRASSGLMPMRGRKLELLLHRRDFIIVVQYVGLRRFRERRKLGPFLLVHLLVHPVPRNEVALLAGRVWQ